MDFEINKRITLVRKTLKLSQTSFGDAIGVSRDVINNIDNLRVPAKPLLIQQICRVYNVDPDWLENGSGEMFLEKDSVTDLFEFTKNLFLDRNLSWVRCLCEYIAQLTPEEQEAAARHIESLAEMIAKEKEQD